FAAKFAKAFQTTGDTSAQAAQLTTYLNALAEKAPSDIKASFKTIADALGKYLDAIKGIDLKPGKTPSPAQVAKVQAAVQQLEQTDVKAASDKIQAWVQGGCK